MEFVSQQEQKNKRYGVIISSIFHTLLIILLLIPLLTYPDPPPGQEGILVNLGIPDIGQGDENAGPSQPVTEQESEPEVEPTPTKEREVQKPTKTDPAPQKDVVRTEDPDAVALREQQKREQAERDRQEREAEARRQAEAEARRKAAEEEARKKAEADKLKDQIGGLFGDGKGKGNTGKQGNQGDPGGDPNASKLEGISTGSGSVGGGLSDRGVSRRGPGVQDNSQSVGSAVISVCVDKDGNVVSAEFTQKGSTISDGSLRSKAIADAKQWKFGKGDVDKQCGTITYRFKVQ